MNNIEVLEDMLAGHQKNILRYNADSFGHKEVVERIAALSRAIELMKYADEPTNSPMVKRVADDLGTHIADKFGPDHPARLDLAKLLVALKINEKLIADARSAIAAMKRMEEIGNVYAKAAAIDREFRLLHVRIDSLCCDLNPNKELPEESK